MGGRYVNIMSKISQETAKEMDAACKAKGFRSKYEAMQCLVSAFLRWASPKRECGTEEAEMLDRMFSGMRGTGDGAKPGMCDPPSAAILFYRDGVRTLRRHGSGYVSCRGFRDPLCIVLEKCHPGLSARLSEMVGATGSDGYAEAIVRALDAYMAGRGISDEVREEFEAYSENHPKPEGGKPVRRRQHHVG